MQRGILSCLAERQGFLFLVGHSRLRALRIRPEIQRYQYFSMAEFRLAMSPKANSSAKAISVPFRAIWRCPARFSGLCTGDKSPTKTQADAISGTITEVPIAE